ncbi:peamaclein-like [Phragmites australis]|uniref:peamaclein-like n=1 Tax=Phragmites australis TaxID=29695 RepID=UPI002D77EDA9|nr:peamaclein-like [Phragmites australis]
MKAISVTLVLLLFVLVASFQDDTVVADNAAVPDGACDAKCRSRCSLKKAGRCFGLCTMCCGKCQGCVPSGPYASKDECPCYRDMKFHKDGRPKCP